MRIAIVLAVGVLACTSTPPEPRYHWEQIPDAVGTAPLEQAVGACRGHAAAVGGPLPKDDEEASAQQQAQRRQVFQGCMYGYGWRRVRDSQ